VSRPRPRPRLRVHPKVGIKVYRRKYFVLFCLFRSIFNLVILGIGPSLSKGPWMVSQQVTAVAPTSKRHDTKYHIITWPCDLRQGQNVEGQGQGHGLTSLWVILGRSSKSVSWLQICTRRNRFIVDRRVTSSESRVVSTSAGNKDDVVETTSATQTVFASAAAVCVSFTFDRFCLILACQNRRVHSAADSCPPNPVYTARRFASE